MKTHAQFHSSNGKRQILIAEDELINQEILKAYLDEYDLLLAKDGLEALALIREHGSLLSLVLLDLIMPGMHGLKILEQMKMDPELAKIPVIVMTADASAEVESLRLGAIDFIPKPYPQKEVVQARVLRTIELSEDRETIHATERDALTGLFNREFFFRYAQQLDQYHKDLPMDALVMNIHHFHMINERFGKSYGDEVLRRVGEKVKETAHERGGIASRGEADSFLIYCPHGEEYAQILENASVGLTENDTLANRVRLRMGVYPNADKSIDIERRFDHAKQAADTARGSYANVVAEYDEALHKQEIYEEQLLEDFHTAIREGQFKVYYQPKFDIRPEIPVLASAEALVRWQHPTFGMISPGIFIPLFENNGLIPELDNYVWREAARCIRDWKQRFDVTVPVSVNVSRVDMYDPNLVKTFMDIMEEFQITPSEFLLEITESAYTRDSAQIIETVNTLRDLGFRIEMDDFGTGYSSLNMISQLPIDALKLDMQFIRMAFSDRKDTRLLEVIIDIADYLAVPVIAEGVETLEQLQALRTMGCDIVQGYYFSRPVPAEEYEKFVKERQEAGQDNVHAARRRKETAQAAKEADVSYGKICHALSSGFENIYYIDTHTGHYLEFSSKGRVEDLQIERSGKDFFAEIQKELPFLVYHDDLERVSLSLKKETLLSQLVGGRNFSMTYRLMVDEKPVYYNLKAVYTGALDTHYLVIGVSNVNEQMKEALDLKVPETDGPDYLSIVQALAADYFSIYYVNTQTGRFVEYSAHNEYQDLEIEKGGEDFFAITQRNILKVIHPDDREKLNAAMQKDTLLKAMEKTGAFTITYRLMFGDRPTYVCLKASRMVGDPSDPHIVIGINNVDEQIRREAELIAAKEKANRDALTGVKSKHAYVEYETRVNEAIKAGTGGEFAVVVCDLNGLKEVNDTQGHQAGDEYIRSASSVICNVFDHSPVFRIGGDEFAVILRGRDYANRSELLKMIAKKNQENAGGYGAIIAVGLSEFDPKTDTKLSTVFDRADSAMYENKSALKGER